MPPKHKATPPSGEGFIVTIDGKSWHNDPNIFEMQKEGYVFETLVKTLAEWQVNRDRRTYDVGRLGISHPVLAKHKIEEDIPIDSQGKKVSRRDSRFLRRGPGAAPPRPAKPDPKAEPEQTITETRFRVEFVWIPTPEAERLEADPNAPAEESEATEAAAAE